MLLILSMLMLLSVQASYVATLGGRMNTVIPYNVASVDDKHNFRTEAANANQTAGAGL